MHSAAFIHRWQITLTTELIWIFIGMTSQLLFSVRFIVESGPTVYLRNIYFIWLGKRAPSALNVA